MAVSSSVLAQNLILKSESGSTVETLPLLEGSTLVIREDGNVEATCADVDLCLGKTTLAPVVFLALAPANPQAADSVVSVLWFVENQFDSCTPTDDADSATDWEISGEITEDSGSRVVQLGSTSITFSLTCVGPFGSGIASITATVTSGQDGGPVADNFQIPTECQGLQPSGTIWGGADVLNNTVIDVNAERFYDVFDTLFTCSAEDELNCLWPGVQGTSAQVVVNRNEYAALKFIATSVPGDSGSVQFSDGSLGGSSPRIYSIAQCPGQFTDLPVGCSQSAVSGTLRWRNNNANFGECELTPGAVYYLNIINAEGGDPSQAACPSASCANNTLVGG